MAANIARLRGGMQYKELAERLAAIGRPLTPVAIRDIENAKRNVTVDDLMAFAIVFDVSPLTLLMPQSGSRNITTHVTGYLDEMGCNVAWLWARADEPLELPGEPGKADAMNEREIELFRMRARPTVIDARTAHGRPDDWTADVTLGPDTPEGEATWIEAARKAYGQLIRPPQGSYGFGNLGDGE